MDIASLITRTTSKATCIEIVNYIGDSEERFMVLLDKFLKNEKQVSVRAGMALSYCFDINPKIVLPHIKTLVKNLQQPNRTDAVKRNTVRILQDVDIPEALLGEVAEICFTYLDNPNEAVAIRAFSIQVLFNICLKEPELFTELKIVLETHLPHGTTGFKNRAKKYLKKIEILKKA